MPLHVLWWGRHGNYGPDYPRNRTIMSCMQQMGWTIEQFQPRVSCWGHLEAWLHKFAPPDLVWVPCFRQRDISSAIRWARSHGVPLVFDPLISAYDKRVNERGKYPANSWRARRLLRQESKLFSLADIVIADTRGHYDYFRDKLGVPDARLVVIPVGAEESLFYPNEGDDTATLEIPEVLFFGSFIALQGPQVITRAISIYDGPPVKWRFLGTGPLRTRCEQDVARLRTAAPGIDVRFEDWIPYRELADRIRHADILLGVFGCGEKTLRVIPNKVFQSLACGKPVITIHAEVYPEALLRGSDSGITWVSADNPRELAKAVATLAADSTLRMKYGKQARNIYENFFSNDEIIRKIHSVVERLKTG